MFVRRAHLDLPPPVGPIMAVTCPLLPRQERQKSDAIRVLLRGPGLWAAEVQTQEGSSSKRRMVLSNRLYSAWMTEAL
jgi:hypothetical protein